MTNWEIAQVFNEIAELLEILGENPFKARAYRKAAQVLQQSSIEAEALVAEGRLKGIPGIGEALSAKITELVKTGRLGYYEELKKKVPDGLREMLLVPGIGAKTLQLLHRHGINSLAALLKAAQQHRLQEVPGIGQKTETAIIRAVESMSGRRQSWLLDYVSHVAGEIEGFLKGLPGVERVSVAGSFRRGRESVSDLDFVAASGDAGAVVRAFTTAPWVQEVLSAEETMGTVLTRWGLRADLMVVPPPQFISALHHFTGSPQHNTAIRQLARERGLMISERGIEREGVTLQPQSEDELFHLLGLAYIPPELREDGSELEAALEGRIPRLVETADIKGDLHLHTCWSDGLNTIEEMAAAARERGYSYLAVTDHTRSLRVARGLTEERVKQQIEEIQRINSDMQDFKVLAGLEVEILTDGRLDFDDRLLGELDLVVASVHSGFRQDRDTLTGRLVGALKNEHVDILGHPTGRLIERREPYDLDLQRVLEVAAETGTALEINAAPDRLDLKDCHIREGKELGVVFSIGTDAHDLRLLDQMAFGVATARRGWAGPEDIINTRTLTELEKWLRHKK